jgi:hypothetical protein
MKFEHELFRKLVSRGKNSLSENFAYGIAFRSSFVCEREELECEGNTPMYVRYVENGSLVGFSETMFRKHALFDAVMTHEDMQELSASTKRQRVNDVKCVLSLWNELKSCISSRCDSLTDVQAWLVVDTSANTLASGINMNSQEMLVCADQVATASSHDLPSFDSIRFFKIHEFSSMSFANQVRAFNCFSNLNISGQNGMGISKGPAYSSWQLSSVRTDIAAGLSTDMLTQKRLEEALSAQRLKSVRDGTWTSSSSSSRRSTSARSQTSARQTSSRSRLPNVPNVQLDDDEIWESVQQFPSMLDRSLTSQVRSSLQQSGACYIVRNDEGIIQIVWNCYNPKSGLLSPFRYCTTTVEFHEGVDPSFTCTNCPSYQHSTQLASPEESDDDSKSNGFCAHTELLKVLVPHLNKSLDLPMLPTDAFVLWALKSVNNRDDQNVQKIADNGGCMKFFVKVSDGTARREDTSQVSFCHIFLRTDTCRMSCSTSRCMQVTMKKQKKQVRALDAVCCHLRAVFEHTEFKHFWDMGASGQGFELGSEEDMQTFIHRLNGGHKNLWNDLN